MNQDLYKLHIGKAIDKKKNLASIGYSLYIADFNTLHFVGEEFDTIENCENIPVQYICLNKALAYCIDKGVRVVDFYIHSESIRENILRNRKIKNPKILELHDEYKRLSELFLGCYVKGSNQKVMELFRVCKRKLA